MHTSVLPMPPRPFNSSNRFVSFNRFSSICNSSALPIKSISRWGRSVNRTAFSAPGIDADGCLIISFIILAKFVRLSLISDSLLSIKGTPSGGNTWISDSHLNFCQWQDFTIIGKTLKLSPFFDRISGTSCLIIKSEARKSSLIIKTAPSAVSIAISISFFQSSPGGI